MSEQPAFRLGVLISGRGSNMAALQEAIEAGKITSSQMAVVISNRADAAGLDWAKQRGLKTVALTPDQLANRHLRDTSIVEILQEAKVDVLLLAGYDRILGDSLLSAFPKRILNIHPSLLPAYGGRGMVGEAVHQAVITAGETESGCTVHLVTEVVDGGSILGQKRVPVLADDTAKSLAKRVLKAEHQLYVETVQIFLQQLKTLPVL